MNVESKKPEGYWAAPKDPEKWQLLYAEYLKTGRWKALKEACFKVHGDRCAMCPHEAFTAHHRNYPDVFGQEDPKKDLRPICLLCHEKYHNPFPTLDEVREKVLKAARRGKVDCPVCKKNVHIYPRILNGNMVRFLISLCVKCQNGSWVHHSRLAYTGRDYSYLSHFGLAESRREVDEGSGARTSGYWRPTDKGKQFVFNNVKSPRHVIIYNNRVLGYASDTVDVRTALGKKFSYTELMKEFAADKDIVNQP